MTRQPLTLNYTPGPDVAGVGSWLHLEQIAPVDEYANARDVYDMWLAASTGRSAQLLRSSVCPVEFIGDTVNIYLGFYVWPSLPDLAYSLAASNGTINPGQHIRQHREFSVFIDNQDSIDLPYFMEKVSIAWETPTFDQYGASIPAPTITAAGNQIEFSTEVFGAVRISGMAIGWHHLLMISIDKPITAEPENGSVYYPSATEIYEPGPILTSDKISNVSSTVTASWVDGAETKNEQLSMKIPKCVEDLLNMCPENWKFQLCWEFVDKIYYYNACKGEIMYVRDGQDVTSFCTAIAPGGSVQFPFNPWGVF
jgi:hypothetical protein